MAISQNNNFETVAHGHLIFPRPAGLWVKNTSPQEMSLGRSSEKYLKRGRCFEYLFKKPTWISKFNSYCLKKHTHEKMSTSLNMRERQIKTSMRYHLTLIRMAIGRNSTSSKCWCVWSTGTLLHWCWEWKLGAGLWRTRGRLLSVKMRTKLDYSLTPYTKSTANRLKISMKGQILWN